MELHTVKAHAEFDLALAKQVYATVKEELCGEQISSPYDLYSVERLREEYNLRKGAAFDTDVFVLGMGSPQKRAVTKISGLPYWPRGRAWPTVEDGAPCQFLAQFNFADSRDLVGKLPGDVLLLFVPAGDGDWLWDLEQVHFEWLDTTAKPLIDALPKGVQPYCQSEWYGVLHRTKDYPDMAAAARRLKVDQAYELAVINGCKIGGIPHLIQSKTKYALDPKTGFPVLIPGKGSKQSGLRFLCQLSSIQAAPDVGYPWTNQKKKLTMKFDDTGIYGDNNQCLFGDMGSIYIFIDSSGRITATSECY